MSHAMQAHSRSMGQSEEFWQKMVLLKNKLQPTPVFFHGEPHEQYENVKRYDTRRWAPEDQKVSNMLWGIVEDNY